MKFIIIALLVSTSLLAQIDTTRNCFTNTELGQIATRLKELRISVTIRDTLLADKTEQIGDLMTDVRIRDNQLRDARSQLAIANTNLDLCMRTNDALKDMIEANRRRWYEAPLLWFGIGVVSTVAAIRL